MKTTALAILFVLLLCWPMAAEASIDAPCSYSIVKVTPSSAAMITQYVSIELSPDFSVSPIERYLWYRFDITAEFTIVSPETERLILGYPLSDSVVVLVDGQSVPTTAATETTTASGATRNLVTWEMDAEKDKPHTITILDEQTVENYQLGHSIRFNHKLSSAYEWGTIDSVIVQLQSSVNHDIFADTTSGYEETDSGIRWELSNTLPEFDVYMSVSNAYYLQDLNIARTARTCSDMITGSRALAATIGEIMHWGWHQSFLEFSQLDSERFDDLVSVALTMLERCDQRGAGSALTALHVSLNRLNPQHQADVFTSAAEAIADGEDLSWWEKEQLLELAQIAYEQDPSKEERMLIAQLIASRMAIWTDRDKSATVILAEGIDRSGYASSFLQIVVQSQDRSDRYLGVITEPEISRDWSFLGPVLTYERTICPQEMGVLAAATVAFAHMRGQGNALEIKSDILKYVDSSEFAVTTQFIQRRPRWARVDNLPATLMPEQQPVTVTVTWVRYPFLWPTVVGAIIALIMGIGFIRKRLKKDDK